MNISSVLGEKLQNLISKIWNQPEDVYIGTFADYWDMFNYSYDFFEMYISSVRTLPYLFQTSPIKLKHSSLVAVLMKLGNVSNKDTRFSTTQIPNYLRELLYKYMIYEEQSMPW